MAATSQREFVFRSWGGPRAGAGRPPVAARPRVPHRARGPHTSHTPVHVTMRTVAALPSLRNEAAFDAVRRTLAASSHDGFRLILFSVQADHLHLLVEADGAERLVRGCQGLAVRVAKAVNRVLGRHARVWGDRYHARALRTPREVRTASAYVLNNWLKHVPGAHGRDPRSSAAWFDGWRMPSQMRPGPNPVVTPRTWLARKGWLRHGHLDAHEGPSRVRRSGASSRSMSVR